MLTGDTLFVGDVGRPDLLATGSPELTADVLGRQLYHSLHDKLLPRLLTRRSCSPRTAQDRRAAGTSRPRPARRSASSGASTTRCDRWARTLRRRWSPKAQPPRPHYFEFDAQRNRELRPLLDGEAPRLARRSSEVHRRLRDAGAVLLDPREPADFAAGHLQGRGQRRTRGRFAEWAASVLDPDADIVLVGDSTTALEAKVRLARVGYDRVVGQLDDLGSASSATDPTTSRRAHG